MIQRASRPPMTILWRLAIALITIQALVAVVLGTFVFNSIRTFHYQQTQEQLSRLASGAINQISPIFASGSDPEEIRAVTVAYAQRVGLRMTVVLPDGTAIADSDFDYIKMDNHRARPEIDEALISGVGNAVRYSSTLSVRMMYHARRIGDSGSPVAIIRIAQPLESVETSLAALTRSMAVFGVLTLVVTLLVMLIVSRSLSNQVAALAQGAERFAAGDLSHRIEVPRTRELADLSGALNDMARQLTEQISELHIQRNELRGVLESMTSGVLALDTEQRVLSANRSAGRILGIDPDSARGRLVHEVVRDQTLHRFVDRSIESGQSLRSEFELETLDSKRCLDLSTEPLLDTAGASAGLLVILTDVTELRRLESVRSDFAANVSHELRTPITNIKGYIETLQQMGVEDIDRTQKFLSIANSNADRLASIVEDLLTLARLEAPAASDLIVEESVTAGAVIAAAVTQLKPAADARSIAIDVDPLAVPPLAGDSRLLEQAVVNLLSNAIRYSPEQTTVHISATQDEAGFVSIRVSDQGAGIAADQLPRLFERFYRIDKARSRALGGTGLGLAIVKHIVLVHGGRVEVDSTPGAGSVFTVVLPVANTN